MAEPTSSSLSGPCTFAVIALAGVLSGAGLALFGHGALALVAAEAVGRDSFVPYEDRHAAEQLASVGGVVSALALTVAWGALVWWGVTVLRNARKLRVKLDFGPGWAIGAWFIPIFNLVGPPLVLAQIGRRANEIGQLSEPERNAPGAMLWLSWLALLGSFVLLGTGASIAQAPSDGGTVTDMRDSNLWLLWSDLLRSISAACLIVVVIGYTRFQQALLDIGQLGNTEPAAARSSGRG